MLFKRLAQLGMGSSLLAVLIAMYYKTSSCLNLNGNIYESFDIYTGVKQGAATSALLFIIYIDQIIQFLKDNCPREYLLDDLHILLHADDALIFSTNRKLFIDKCNKTINKFTSMQLSLNVGKSGFLVINSSNVLDKLPINTNIGYLPYKSQIKYLGVIVSDTGSLINDINILVNN